MSEAETHFCMWCLADHDIDACPVRGQLPAIEPDPVEAIQNLDTTGRINIYNMKQPTVEQLLQKLIGIQIDLTNALTTMADSFNALAESNQAIVDAMLQSEGVDPESNPNQTLD